jgi:quinone-modifying oxidoreductase subunit QmoA
MTAAIEAAEVGYPVVLVEKEPSLGGRVLRAHRYFPKMCPPACGFEINVRRIRRNPRITVYTLATVESITRKLGKIKATIRVRPRYVTGERTIDDGVLDQLTSERDNDFNLKMDRTKAVYMPHDMAYPHVQVVDREALSDADAEILKSAAPAGAVDLDMLEEEIDLEVGAVVVATGWKPYDATKLDNLGFGKFPNVINNVMMERLANEGGPTGGEIQRPSDGKKPQNVAFVQCAGSRDETHLPYCSAICCLASLKQVRYLREADENVKATVFYIDIRTIGRLEKFYYDMLDDENVRFVKGKVARITEEAGTNDLILDVEDTMSADNLHEKFDFVVLATGIVPNTVDEKLPLELAYDEYGFISGDTNVEGVFAAGCATHPCDVSRSTKEATAAALKAIQFVNQGK